MTVIIGVLAADVQCIGASGAPVEWWMIDIFPSGMSDEFKAQYPVAVPYRYFDHDMSKANPPLEVHISLWCDDGEW